MEIQPHSRRAFLLALLVWALAPELARADAINFDYVVACGLAVLVPLTLFVVLVESFFIGKGLRISYRRAIWPVLIANTVSLIAGIPTKILNYYLYYTIMPRPLTPYFRMYPYAVALGSLIFLVVTLLVEYLVIALWGKWRAIAVNCGRVAKYVLLANVVTYAVLAPLHYYLTRPTHNIREFTDDSTWARRPETRLFYINAQHQLCSIMTDGSGEQLIVPDTVRDYQYVPAAGVILYRNGDNALCYYRESDKKQAVCWKGSQGNLFLMNEVACSPDGRTVAYVDDGLCLFDIKTSRTLRTGIQHGNEIAWSTRPDVLHMRTYLRPDTPRHPSHAANNPVRSVTIDSRLSCTLSPDPVTTGSLAIAYGRFKRNRSSWSAGTDWGARFGRDEAAGMTTFIESGLGSHVEVKGRGEPVTVAVNPGLIKLAKRGFNDVAFVDASGAEVVFDDSTDIYLMDVNKRKVGRIAEGTRFMLFNDRYRRKIFE